MVAFVVVVVVLMVGISFFLRSYTRHDSVLTVPDVTSLSVKEAIPFLEKKGLRYKVVDSIRVETAPPGVILEQKPLAGSRVKQNRFVFLTINATSEEQVPFPDVKDFSQRQAVATLEANGLRVGSVEFQPSEYRDLVLGVRYNGRNIQAGFRLPKNSAVVLIVGGGDATGDAVVPGLHQMYLAEAIAEAHARGFNVGDVHYDVTPVNAEDAKKYRIYRQKPITGTSVGAGQTIELWLTTDEQLLQEPEEVYAPGDSVQ
jgi:beta-lactam-binding protein with PASTA domain